MRKWADGRCMWKLFDATDTTKVFGRIHYAKTTTNWYENIMCDMYHVTKRNVSNNINCCSPVANVRIARVPGSCQKKGYTSGKQDNNMQQHTLFMG